MTAYVVDTETTGVVEPIEVVEVAWIRLTDPPGMAVAGEFCERYRPSEPIELGALATHHIMDEDLVECWPSSDFALPPDATIVVGYKVDYDWKAIGQPKVRRIDVMAMAEKCWPSLGRLSQAALLYHVDRQNARARLVGSHSAARDAHNCLFLLRAVVLAAGGFADWKAMWDYSEAGRVPTVMPFGKHKGVPMADVPADYKRWLLSQPDVDPYLAQALSRAR